MRVSDGPVHPLAARASLLLCLLIPRPSSVFGQTLEHDLQAFDARLAQLRTEHRLPGLSAAIVRERELVWSNGYGWADDEVPVTPDTPFCIASVTKPILGLLFQEYRGVTLYWHPRWDEEAGFSALYLKVPDRDSHAHPAGERRGTLVGQPVDKAAVEGSPFARAFLDQFVFGKAN